MDDKTFDAFTRAFATTSRRSVLKRLIAGFAGGVLAARGIPTQAASDCAHFCRNLPPKLRGSCVSDCQQGKGLYAGCGGDPMRLCVESHGTTATCCAAGDLCQGGVCGNPQCTGLGGLCHESS